MKVVEKERENRKVVRRLEDKLCLERDIKVEWICTLPQEKELKVAKEVGEVVLRTREAMRVVGATLTAIHKALHQQRWC